MDEAERQLVDEVSRNGYARVHPMDDGEYEAAQRLEKQGYTLRLCGKALCWRSGRSPLRLLLG